MGYPVYAQILTMRIDDISGLAPWAQKQILEKLKKNSLPGTEKPSQVSAPKGKFGNIPTEHRGIKFQSQKEARRFEELMVLLAAGKIHDLRLQHNFTLQEGYTKPDGERVRGIVYQADFTYKKLDDTGQEIFVVEDVKSRPTKTKVYIIKKKLMLEKFGIEIQEI